MKIQNLDFEEIYDIFAIRIILDSDIENEKRPVIFSAHGVPKSVPQEAKIKNLSFVILENFFRRKNKCMGKL